MDITYNRQAAVEYAKKWAFLRNPAFFNFETLGGDCTNFISQCLLAGDMPMNFTPIYGWYYKNLKNRAPAFSSAKYLYNFLTREKHTTGPVAIECEIKDLEVGDIIQLTFDNAVFTHSLLVVKAGEDPQIAAHTYDAFGRKLSSYTHAVGMRGLHVLGGRR